MTTTLHLIDASPYLFRAFFSVPKTVVDPEGRPANRSTASPTSW
jgi:5'-3' exonuclease